MSLAVFKEMCASGILLTPSAGRFAMSIAIVFSHASGIATRGVYVPAPHCSHLPFEVTLPGTRYSPASHLTVSGLQLLL
jgi:hypothetical protein